jgi:ADP-heptose:LPS heptosyltransferase
MDGVSYLPERVFGDDANWGSGHLIQLKEAFFDLPPSPAPKPEIYLSCAETRWAQRILTQQLLPTNQGKPLVVLHPWGKTRNSVLNRELWARLVRENSERYRFWQVGIQGQVPIPGCENYLLLSKAAHHARKLFAILSQAVAFLGVDSGPMHAARAFNLPSFILIDHAIEGATPEQIFEQRKRHPYFLFHNWKLAFLYEQNQHLYTPRLEAGAISRKVGDFLASGLGSS